MPAWRSRPRRSFCRLLSRSGICILQAGDGCLFGQLPSGSPGSCRQRSESAGCHIPRTGLDKVVRAVALVDVPDRSDARHQIETSDVVKPQTVAAHAGLAVNCGRPLRREWTALHDVADRSVVGWQSKPPMSLGRRRMLYPKPHDARERITIRPRSSLSASRTFYLCG